VRVRGLDDGLVDHDSDFVDATNLVNDLRRDLRRVRRCLRVHTVLLAIILIFTIVLPTTVVFLHP
jgi:hypothetical protein